MKRRRRSTAGVGLALLVASLSAIHGQNGDSWVVSPVRSIGSRDHQLAVARGMLADAEEHTLGPWTLLTDASVSTRTTDFLRSVCTQLPSSYRQRLGVDPRVGDSWLVLFPDKDGYHNFRARFGTGLTEAAEGHATVGLAATFVGDHTRDHLAALVVHESIHLLNRATFDDRLPTWLDEGLATSLSHNRIDSDGRLLLGTISSRSRSAVNRQRLPDGRSQTVHRIQLQGPMAALLAYSERPQDWPPLAALTADWSQTPDSRLELLYPQAGFLVRYLLDGADRDTQTAFRALLAELAVRPRPELVTAFENRLPDLDRGFRRWLGQIARQSLAQLKPGES